MKIKNFLALGLIAIVSGISTAQTYTGTAGTNGVTGIQSDYSMATGDGASVSVDVPLEFELPKKVAIAVRDSSNNLPSSSLFDQVTAYKTWFTSNSDVVDITPLHSGAPNITTSRVGVNGAIYANTAISVTADISDFVHEIDSNSIMEHAGHFRIYKNNATGTIYGTIIDNQDSSTTLFPGTVSVDETILADNSNQVGFEFYSYLLIDTIDPTDRAGKYLSTAVVTVTTL